VRLSVCLFVCPHDKTKTVESKITKLDTGIVTHDTPATIDIRSKFKVRVRVRRSNRVASMSYTPLSGASLVDFFGEAGSGFYWPQSKFVSCCSHHSLYVIYQMSA